jgi:hypothetical protein
MAPYGFVTGETPVSDCFLCPDNRALAFKPWVLPDLRGYAVPGSLPVRMTVAGNDKTLLVPFPFTALAAPSFHPTWDADGYGYTFPDDWTSMFRRLLGLLPGLEPGDPRSEISQVGFEAGARVPLKIQEAGIPAHPWKWVVWGRDKLAEVDVTDKVKGVATRNLGLATIIHQSRQAAGSLPSDTDLLDLWTSLETGPDPVGAYHRELLTLAA